REQSLVRQCLAHDRHTGPKALRLRSGIPRGRGGPAYYLEPRRLLGVASPWQLPSPASHCPDPCRTASPTAAASPVGKRTMSADRCMSWLPGPLSGRTHSLSPSQASRAKPTAPCEPVPAPRPPELRLPCGSVSPSPRPLLFLSRVPPLLRAADVGRRCPPLRDTRMHPPSPTVSGVPVLPAPASPPKWQGWAPPDSAPSPRTHALASSAEGRS
ncbi:hypothetical protein K5549_018316, partial [Capra hircus]